MNLYSKMLVGQKVKILRYSDKNNNEVEKYRGAIGTILKSNYDLSSIALKVDDEELILNKNFSDEWTIIDSPKEKYLKSGAVVYTNDHLFGLVIGDYISFKHNNKYIKVSKYNDDLVCVNPIHNIDAIYKRNNYGISDWVENIEVIWQRQKPKQLTLGAIEHRLGYKIELLKKK